MIHLPVTSFYAALLTFMFIVLSANVIRTRRKRLVALMDGGDKVLMPVIRAHANFIEYSALFILLMALIEAQRIAQPGLLHLYGSLFILGRLSHAFSLLVVERRKGAFNVRFRVTGMVITLTLLGAMALMLLVYGLQ